jgi:dienelactone hydrolase
MAGLARARHSTAYAAEQHEAPTKRGVNVQIIESLPRGSGPFPVVVLANGRAGTMRSELPEAAAASLVAQGLAVVRFDWAFRTADPKNGQQSASLDDEVEDMAAALAFAKADKRLDAANIVLMGKSLGSVVSFRLFDQNSDVRGLVLLTPLCGMVAEGPGWARDPYPALQRQTRPIALVAGDKDPVCATPALYKLASEASGPVRVVVVGGDHSFAAGPESDPTAVELSRRNLDLAIRNAVDAAAHYARR